LLVAFPRAYSILMPAMYLPVIVMLLALVFRGVAFEFREIGANKALWNAVFAGGSTLAGFAQGVILAGLIQGIRVENGQFAGGAFDWATPFAVLCGLGLLSGYALLGATWLVMKTEGTLAVRSRAQAMTLLYLVLGFMAAVSLWTPLQFPQIRERWFSLPNFYYLWPVPLLTAVTAFVAWTGLRMEHNAAPFRATIVLFLLGFAGLVISAFPYLVPPSLTIWDTAAAPASQAFMLVGTLVLLPLILAYTAYVYWIFRGKVREGGYH
jgi:cytochrome d ubiquinol oxidase subunit II